MDKWEQVARQAAYDWIRDHAPLSVKMTLMPSNIAPLVAAFSEIVHQCEADTVRRCADRAARWDAADPLPRVDSYGCGRRDAKIAILSLLPKEPGQ